MKNINVKTIVSILFSIFSLLITSKESHATHGAAAYMTFKAVPDTSGFSYQVYLTYYTDPIGGVDRPSLTVNMGDANIQLNRINGMIAPGDSIPGGEITPYGFKKSIYSGIHTYNDLAPFRVISFTDPNRVADIVNMTTSVNVQLYIEDTLFMLDPSIYGYNEPPIFTYDNLVDIALLYEPYYFNFNFFDIDGDSLSFKLVEPLQQTGSSVPGYIFPEDVMAGPDNQFSLNELTGEISWNAPQATGLYLISILLTEYRNQVKLATYQFDFLIKVILGPNSVTDVFNNTEEIEAYPNPFSDYIEIFTNLNQTKDLNAYLYDSSGKLVHQSSHNVQSGKTNTRISVPDQIPAGYYILKLKSSSENKLHQIRVVKQ